MGRGVPIDRLCTRWGVRSGVKTEFRGLEHHTRDVRGFLIDFFLDGSKRNLFTSLKASSTASGIRVARLQFAWMQKSVWGGWLHSLQQRSRSHAARAAVNIGSGRDSDISSDA